MSLNDVADDDIEVFAKCFSQLWGVESIKKEHPNAKGIIIEGNKKGLCL